MQPVTERFYRHKVRGQAAFTSSLPILTGPALRQVAEKGIQQECRARQRGAGLMQRSRVAQAMTEVAAVSTQDRW